MSTQVLSPFPFFTTRDGKPLNLGFVYIGEPNQDPQLFPKAVYWDEALTQPAAQPIRTDGGYIVNTGTPATLYTDGAFSIRTRANSAGSPGAQVFYLPYTISFADLISGPSGSALIGFVQSGAGAVARTVQGKLRDVLDAFDFVPVAMQAGIIAGTNSDDLSPYLQAAINTGRLVRLPAIGTLNIASPLLIPSGGGIIGGGFRSIIKAKANFGNVPLIRNANDAPATLAARDKGIVLDRLLIDGNKAANGTATEFSHCVHFLAVDGAWINIATQDPKGDGVLISYSRAFDGSSLHPEVGCSNINGYIRTLRAARMGVAVTCCDGFDLSVYADAAALFGFDIEPDSETSHVRNGFARVSASGCGTGSGTRGGVAVTGTNSGGTAVADVRNVTIDMQVENCTGDGFVYRDVLGLTARGSIDNQTGNGIRGLDGGVGASRILFDMQVDDASARGMTVIGNGDNLSGEIQVVDSAAIGIFLQTCNGGSLKARVFSPGEQGIYLQDTTNMTFPDAVVQNSVGGGVVCAGNSSGNRFPSLKATGDTSSHGFREADTANDNRTIDARLSGNSGGPALLVGATSLVTLEQLFGKATYDPPSLTDGNGATTTVTVTGAAVGDEAQAAFSNALQGITVTAWVSATNTVSVRFQNETGGTLDLASGTLRAFVTPRVMA